jgi:hypothetical protein
VRLPAAARHDVVQPVGDVGVVVEAEDLSLGQRVGQPGPVALGQAPRRDHRGAAPGGAEQLVDRVLLGRLDEAAGVDQHDVGVVPFFGQRPAGPLQPAREFLGVDLIAGAAHRDQADAAPSGLPGRAGLARGRGILARRHIGRLR